MYLFFSSYNYFALAFCTCFCCQLLKQDTLSVLTKEDVANKYKYNAHLH